MKEIQLTEGDMCGRDGEYNLIVYQELKAGNSVLLIPPKRKTVKLSELPDGTVVSTTDNNNAFVSKGRIYWAMDTCGKGYARVMYSQAIEVVESPKQVWEGGECPYPNGVKVRCCYRDGVIEEGNAVDFEWNWNSERIANHKRSEIIWHQAISLLDGWELEK